jgi:hypothetical protein
MGAFFGAGTLMAVMLCSAPGDADARWRQAAEAEAEADLRWREADTEAVARSFERDDAGVR